MFCNKYNEILHFYPLILVLFRCRVSLRRRLLQQVKGNIAILTILHFSVFKRKTHHFIICNKSKEILLFFTLEPSWITFIIIIFGGFSCFATSITKYCCFPWSVSRCFRLLSHCFYQSIKKTICRKHNYFLGNSDNREISM